MNKKISLVTSSRADWSYAFPLVKAISSSKKIKLRLAVTGMHFFKKYGNTVDDITSSGFDHIVKIPIKEQEDNPVGVCQSFSEYIKAFSKEFSSNRPDILVLLGDRTEILPIALASLPFNVSIAHIGGGDVTLGALDESIRHSLTKLSHLHFTGNRAAYRRVIQMGEEKWRVFYTGSLGVDSVRQTTLLSITDIKKTIPFVKSRNYLLVTQHPETLTPQKTKFQIQTLLKALDELNLDVVFTFPNIDISNEVIIQEINEYAKNHENVFIIKNAGRELYYSLVKHAAAIVGNSSSGIYDTPYFKVPAVDIGCRQEGRIRAKNVVNVQYEKNDIIKGIKKILKKRFRDGLNNRTKTFFGSGHASARITKALEEVEVDERLLMKKFVK